MNGYASPTMVIVGVTNRDDFDRIDLEVLDHRALDNDPQALLSKATEGHVKVIFQHWLSNE